jgi:hypothetical protein
MTPKKTKPFLKMTPAEREADLKGFDKGLSFDQTRPLSAKGKLLWQRAKRGRPPKPAGQKAARVLITVEQDLLARADAFAKERGLSRSELIARGIHSVLAEVA